MCREQIINLLVHNLQRFDEVTLFIHFQYTSDMLSESCRRSDWRVKCAQLHREYARDSTRRHCTTEHRVRSAAVALATSATQGAFRSGLCSIRLQVNLMLFLQNKSYAAEILGMLLQSSDDVRKAVGELNGIDLLLQVCMRCYNVTQTRTLAECGGFQEEKSRVIRGKGTNGESLRLSLRLSHVHAQSTTFPRRRGSAVDGAYATRTATVARLRAQG